MQTETLTLTDFLLARIAEDEERATRVGLSGGTHPVRAVAECEAKRRIMAQATEAESAAAGIRSIEWGANPRGDVERAGYNQAAAALREVLYAVASVYADHPDYRDEWRP